MDNKIIMIVSNVAICIGLYGNAPVKNPIERERHLRARLTLVKPGDSLAKVIEMLGKPDKIVRLTKVRQLYLLYYIKAPSGLAPDVESDRYLQVFFDKSEKFVEVLWQ